MDALIFAVHPIWYDHSLGGVFFGMNIICIFLFILVWMRKGGMIEIKDQDSKKEKKYVEIPIPTIEESEFEEKILKYIRSIYQDFFQPDDIYSKTGDEISYHIRNETMEQIVRETEVAIFQGYPIGTHRRSEILEILHSK